MLKDSIRPRKPHRKPTEIARILAEYEASDLTQTAFVAERGIALSTFQLWRRKARRDALPAGTNTMTPSFVEVLAEPTGDHFELKLPDGVHLRVPPHFHEESLKTLLVLLSQITPSASCSR